MAPMANLMERISKSIASGWSDTKVYMLKQYGENPGKMLVHTGTLGWILSSLAQIGAVAFNDKISPEQKSFLIPQEMADAAVNILSFYMLTNSIKTLGSKLVSTGKLRTKTMKNFLEQNGLMNRVGKFDFDFGDAATYGKNIQNIDFKPVQDDYKAFKNGIDVVASTIGSVISCNILTPVVRNEYASKRQRQTIAAMQKRQFSNIQAPKGISIDEYQMLAASKYSHSGGMRV